jgi:hypothetical protein
MLLMRTYLAGPAGPVAQGTATLPQCNGHAAAVTGTLTSAHTSSDGRSSSSCDRGCSISASSSAPCSDGISASTSSAGGGSTGSNKNNSSTGSSGGCSSSSSSKLGDEAAAAAAVTDDVTAAAAAGGGATAAAAAGADATLAHAHKQQWQQLTCLVTGVWQLVGFQPEALPLFAEAILADERVLKCMRDAPDGPLSSASKHLPEDRSLVLQARYHTMTEVSNALFAIIKPPDMEVGQWVQDGMPVSLDTHSRQQQQLLQAVCWQLPELLLRSALLCGEGDPLFAAAAAAAATWTLSYWRAPGMKAATAAAKPQRLPALLDCWLQLMLQSPLSNCSLGILSQQQQQQPPPLGLLLQVAASARSLPADSSAAQHLLCAGLCSCDRRNDVPLCIFGLDTYGSSSGSGSTSISSARLCCLSLGAVGHLLECLESMKVRGRGWVASRCKGMGVCKKGCQQPWVSGSPTYEIPYTCLVVRKLTVHVGRRRTFNFGAGPATYAIIYAVATYGVSVVSASTTMYIPMYVVCLVQLVGLVHLVILLP